LSRPPKLIMASVQPRASFEVIGTAYRSFGKAEKDINITMPQFVSPAHVIKSRIPYKIAESP
jgi:hypothetical protein